MQIITYMIIYVYNRVQMHDNYMYLSFAVPLYSLWWIQTESWVFDDPLFDKAMQLENGKRARVRAYQNVHVNVDVPVT